jgi:low affinity Fe/Cu permease
MHWRFSEFAKRSAAAVGSPYATLAAVLTVIAWSLSGPLFQFSDTWQLVINTGTTIVTFLMVFLIQNSQNRDAQAIHLKLDELICAMKDARLELVDIENSTDEVIHQHHKEFEQRRALARKTREATVDPESG